MSDQYVKCNICGLDKAPRGRSIPLGLRLCNSTECKGYNQEPLASQYWPGERDRESEDNYYWRS